MAASSSADATRASIPVKWDASHLPNNITLSADGTTAMHSTSFWSMVRGDKMLSAADSESGVVEVEFAMPCVDNISLYLGVAEQSFFDEASAAAAEGGELLPRDSKHAIVIHGDGRVFIKGKENMWGLMRISTGDPVLLTLDFVRGVATFKLTRTVGGREKETSADVPGLFRQGCYLIGCFGGREQEVAIARCAPRPRGARGGGAGWGHVRDTFSEAIGERVAPIPFSAPSKTLTYEQRLADVARTLER